MPGVPVARSRHGMIGVHSGPTRHGVSRRHGRRAALRPGQGEMQAALCHQRAQDGRDRCVAAPGQRPHDDELGHGRQRHQSPRDGPFGDDMVAEGRQHRAKHSEQPGPHTRHRRAGFACSGTGSMLRRAVVVRHGRSSFPIRHRSCPGICEASQGPQHAEGARIEGLSERCGVRWRGRGTGWSRPGRVPPHVPCWS